jgi:hypothetical protein
VHTPGNGSYHHTCEGLCSVIPRGLLGELFKIHPQSKTVIEATMMTILIVGFPVEVLRATD